LGSFKSEAAALTWPHNLMEKEPMNQMTNTKNSMPQSVAAPIYPVPQALESLGYPCKQDIFAATYEPA